MKYLQMIRIKHWIKNGLVFLPLLFSGMLFDSAKLIQSLIGFLSFCISASIVYIINDLKDVDKDRKHPVKCNRPIASGAVSIKQAIIVMIGLAIMLVVLIFLMPGEVRIKQFVCLLLYISLNIGYSLGMKNVPLVDVAILVAGFFLRVLTGAVITEISISNWLYLTVIVMSLYLGLGKRRNELVHIGKEDTRKVLKAYNKDFLDKNMYVSLALVIVFYSLWSVDAVTTSNGTKNLYILTVPLVVLICMRYSLIIEGDSYGDPVEVLIKDIPLVMMCLLYGLSIICIVYLL